MLHVIIYAMRRLAKKLLVPHEKNNFHPYLLRASGIFAFLLLVTGAFVTVNIYRGVLEKNNFLAAILPSILVDLTNSDREALALNTLSVNPTLVEAAQMKADDMAGKSYFAHTSPEGINPWYWFSKAGYRFAFAGENLAIKFDDSDMVNTAWMNSPTHRANILNDKFTEIGIATSRGVYEGQETIFVVQMFGSPSKQIFPIIPEAVAETIEPTATTTTPAVTTKKIPKTSKPTPTPEPKIIPIASSEVLGAKTAETFVAVEDTSNEVAVISPEPLMRPTTPIVEVSKVEKIAASPSKILAIFYFMLSILLFIVLLFVLFTVHTRRIHNTLSIIILLLIIVISYYGYQSLALSKIQILDSPATDSHTA